MENEKKTGYAEDFPSSANEPVFEALPDYRLTTDETPLFETGENKLATSVPESQLFTETTLDEKTLSELEAFIARARALKGSSAPAEGFSPVSPQTRAINEERQPVAAAGPSSAPKPKPQPRNIPFEVDFGNGRVEDASSFGEKDRASKPKEPAKSPSPVRSARPSFEFAFSSGSPEATDAPVPRKLAANHAEPAAAPSTSIHTGELPADYDRAVKKARGTKTCPDCATTLPRAARFCFSCGYPQPEFEAAPEGGGQAPLEEEVLVLEELPLETYAPTEAGKKSTNSFGSITECEATDTPAIGVGARQEQPSPSKVDNAKRSKPSGAISTRKYTMAELKQLFREHFQERIIAYFGEPRLKKYYAALEESNSFQQLRDGSLTNLLNWINGGERTYAGVARRLTDTMADLTEYFVVEIASDLHGGALPQRLLRHQSADWETVDLFKLVMDYLDFESETERVYTDFVAMPARALRNASNAFLRAGKDERIFFICDQSLISHAKNGFAVTDAGVYWKNVLQPAGSALFTTMEKVSLNQGHLDIDGQFFNAGGRLNLKMAVLLDKLRRMA